MFVDDVKLIVFCFYRGTYRVDEATGAALQTVEQEMAAGVDVHNDLGDGAVRFRHDPRLVLSTRVYLTNEQVDGYCVWCLACRQMLVLRMLLQRYRTP